MSGPRPDDEAVVCLLRQALPELVAIYRFGSRTTGLSRPDSDEDLAVLPAAPLDPVRVWRTAQDLSARIGRDVDLVDLLAASTVMRAQVVSTGMRVFCADLTRAGLFEDMTYSAYALLNEERRGILEDIRSRGTVYA